MKSLTKNLLPGLIPKLPKRVIHVCLLAFSFTLFTTTMFSQTSEPSILASVSPVGAIEANNGSIVLTVSGTNPPFSILWSNGETGTQISNLFGGIYTVTVSDAMGQSTDTAFWVDSPTPLSWNLQTTANPILVSTNTTCFNFEGNAVPPGSLLRIYNENQSADTTYGYGIWNGNELAFRVFLDDTLGQTGFHTLDQIKMEYFHTLMQTDYMAYSCMFGAFISPYGIFGSSFTLSQIECVKAKSSYNQIKMLSSNWDGFALSVYAPGLSAADAFGAYPNIKIVTDDEGNTWWPDMGIDMIPELVLGKGYMVYSTDSSIVEIEGEFLGNATHTVSIREGACWLGYFGENEVLLPQVFYEFSYYSYPSSVIVMYLNGLFWWNLFNIGLQHILHTGDIYRLFNFPANAFIQYNPYSCNSF